MEGASQSALQIFVSAGEQSGEIHGASLIHALKKLSPALKVSGLGGELMLAEGAQLLHHIDSLAAVGLVDVVKKYSYFRKVLAECLEYVKKNNPQVVVLIDYPGFNLRFAEALRKFYTGKIIYYISPQLWAWHERRVGKIKKFVDKMLVVFPFEVDFYKRLGVEAEYVGHPLVKRIKEFLERDKRTAEGLTVTLMPGSRKNEIANHLPVLLKAAKVLKYEHGANIRISKAVSVSTKAFEPYIEEMLDFELTDVSSYSLILNSDLVMCKAGTSTLECALIGTPHFVFLRTSPVNYALMKPIVKINNISILNIISGCNIVKEFIQKDFTPANVLEESVKIISDKAYRNLLIENLHTVWSQLGDKDASANAAAIIYNLALGQ
jgi:lipid-A-disaccharide synthase